MDNGRALVILGGGVVQKRDGTWGTTMFDDQGDRAGILGDHLRVEAAAYLYKQKEAAATIRLFASGGHGYLQVDDRAPTLAQVIAQELEALGVPSQVIIVDETPNNTYEQLLALERYSAKYGTSDYEIISNRYHLPRIRAMFQHLKMLRSYLGRFDLSFVNAETVCLQADAARWGKIIERACASEAMVKRIALEQKGIEDLVAGRYKV